MQINTEKSWFKKKSFNINNNKFIKHQIGILQFLQDHEKMKTGLMSAENYISKYI